MQRTIGRPVTLEGIGLHTGERVRMTCLPADVDAGVVIRRADLLGTPEISLRKADVGSSIRETEITQNGVSVHTVEHLLAALAILNIHNIIVELDNEEVPAVDGSSQPFALLLREAGIVDQRGETPTIEIEKPIWISREDRHIIALPHKGGLRVSFTMDYSGTILGTQYAQFDITPEVALEELAPSRTFGFLSEVEALWKRGLARGGSLENCVVVGDDRIINTEGLRFPDEPVRHKILDLVGNLFLLGTLPRAQIIAIKSGHSMNIELVKEIKKEYSNGT
ncbi:MAG: UDP-3-O-acyl-N-acetylglucosamine deacetylase [bacterium]